MEKERTHEVNKGKKCKVEGCNHTARAKGYCHRCYGRINKKKKLDKLGI